MKRSKFTKSNKRVNILESYESLTCERIWCIKDVNIVNCIFVAERAWEDQVFLQLHWKLYIQKLLEFWMAIHCDLYRILLINFDMIILKIYQNKPEQN